MQIWITLMLAVQLLAALAMIGLVLIQHGKGADMGASFGSGASGSLFGATGSANFLSRSTAVCAAVFFACTLALAFMLQRRPRAAAPSSSGGSVLDRAAPAASAPRQRRRSPARRRRLRASGRSGGDPGPGAPLPARRSRPAARDGRTVRARADRSVSRQEWRWQLQLEFFG